MSDTTFRDALADAGIAADVESFGKIALVRNLRLGSESDSDPNAALSGPARRRLVALGREHGFSSISLELTARDENLPGD